MRTNLHLRYTFSFIAICFTGCPYTNTRNLTVFSCRCLDEIQNCLCFCNMPNPTKRQLRLSNWMSQWDTIMGDWMNQQSSARILLSEIFGHLASPTCSTHSVHQQSTMADGSCSIPNCTPRDQVTPAVRLSSESVHEEANATELIRWLNEVPIEDTVMGQDLSHTQISRMTDVEAIIKTHNFTRSADGCAAASAIKQGHLYVRIKNIVGFDSDYVWQTTTRTCMFIKPGSADAFNLPLCMTCCQISCGHASPVPP